MIEPLDRNKSALTHRATATAAAWLDGLGCKPVETEIPCNGWIVDVGSFWTPTLTEAKRARLLKDVLPAAESTGTYSDMETLYRRFGGRFTIAVEIKVSRADLLADFGRKYSDGSTIPTLDPPAHLCILAAPANIVAGNMNGWGWLQLSDDCSRVRKWVGPWHIHRQHRIEVEDFIAAVAIRRDHQTRYASARRWLKAYRAREDK